MLEPDASFGQAQLGEIVAWECDLDTPPVIRLLSQDGGAMKMLKLYDSALAGLDNGLSVGGIGGSNLTPEQSGQLGRAKTKLAFAKELMKSVDVPRVVVGNDEGTPWTVFGTLKPEHLVAADIDAERLLIVGKIKRKVPPGEMRRIGTSESFGLQPELGAASIQRRPIRQRTRRRTRHPGYLSLAGTQPPCDASN